MRIGLWIAGGVVGVAVGAAALGAAATVPSRRSVLARLERPAAGQASRSQARSRSGIVVALAPARADVPNQLRVRLADRGRRATGARVTVTFSMPSMNMWHAYSAVLRATGPGRYAATVPILGMAGAWQLRVDVAGPGGRRTGAAVSELLVP